MSLDGDDIYWLEGRPQEGGRHALVKRTPDGGILEVTPPEIDVRSRVHEYGGAAYTAAHETVYCANFADQRVYRIRDGVAQPLTAPGLWCYADFEIDTRRRRLICVREDHTQEGREPVNTLVSIGIGPPGTGLDESSHGSGCVLASGADFYSTPRLSPDGSKLVWLSWNHPSMPWDGTEFWAAQVGADGGLEAPRRFAGGPEESIYQPGWSPDGTLYYVSDRDGWWKLYRVATDPTNPANPTDPTEPTEPTDRNITDDAGLATAEFGRPQWVFGTSTWACAGRSGLVVSYTRAGRWRLATIDLRDRAPRDIAVHVEPHDWIAANATHAVLVAGSSTRPDAVALIDLASGVVETLRSASSVQLDAGDISVAEAIEFPTAGRQTAHTFYYPPCNKAFAVAAGETPPLVVISHGGPTSAARSTLDLRIQYWTTRGFAVADVNYGGSSGYGRAYRQRLNGRWGHVDVADVIHAAQFLVERGKADGNRAVIRGGSAGGYTTLAALTFHPEAFKAGASYYGISDLEVLALDTHKFESRYMDTLIGPYPAARETYRARSPIHAVDRLACPLILFQGLEDRVVPPNQSRMMADAVRAKGLPVAYLAFEGEQHGFRKADTIIRSLEAELFFYGAAFGFTPADHIPPVPIDNLRP